GSRLHRHGAAMAQPGHRGHRAVGLGSMGAMKAVQAAEELCFEPIDRPSHVDEVRGQGVRRDVVKGLVDEGIDSVLETVSGVPDRECFHRPIVPNTCSLRTPTTRTMWSLG